MQLRDYQKKLVDDVYQAWSQGAQNVIARLDTGGGKTAILSSIARENQGHVCVIAHRQELVSQISVSLARWGVHHRIIAADKTCKAIAWEHVDILGRSYLAPGAPVIVASVDTLIRRDNSDWAPRVSLWIVDEAHHLVRDNKWHQAVRAFPSARGLMPTATPWRADGKGLGRHASGVADAMVEGPPMRRLIENGFLCDYRIFCPKSDLKIAKEVSASGDWSPAVLKEASLNSNIHRDTVDAYRRFCSGTRAAVFTTDLESAARVAREFVSAGVPAEVLSGDTETNFRRAILKRLESGQTQALVTVDVVSEGFDLPCLDAVIMDRPTQSLGLYRQQFGRTLRPSPGKTHALVVDLVGNFMRHGPPDTPRIWPLEDREKRSASATDAIAMRICGQCWQPSPRYMDVCVHCGAPPEPPKERSAPQFVEGDIAELDPKVLADMRNAIAKATMTREQYLRYAHTVGMPGVAVDRNWRVLEGQQRALAELRELMEIWGGVQRSKGLSDREMAKLFYITFNIDVLTAQALKEKEADALSKRLRTDLGHQG